jgi:hypothetical protein
VIFQKISHFQLDEEDTEKIKVRQKDQMLKVNMSYRLVKCCLEDIFGNEADSKMIGIIDTLDIFLSDI